MELWYDCQDAVGHCIRYNGISDGKPVKGEGFCTEYHCSPGLSITVYPDDNKEIQQLKESLLHDNKNITVYFGNTEQALRIDPISVEILDPILTNCEHRHRFITYPPNWKVCVDCKHSVNQ